MIKVDREEIQSELKKIGLDVKVCRRKPIFFCRGKFNNKHFTIKIPSKNKETGFRDFMIAFFPDKENENFVPLLSKFMKYRPFCRHFDKWDAIGFVHYEWSKINPAERLVTIRYSDNVYQLERFENGF